MNKKILIFDDDQDILNICSIILKAKGYEVFTSMTCKDLFDTVLHADPAVIVMDNKIPETGGVEATRSIKNDLRTKHIPVIFFSANTYIAELAKEAGTVFYIQKPFDIAAFEEILEQAFRSEYLDNKTV
ncbi:MAG: response regulator [Bacteroidota bacterium]